MLFIPATASLCYCQKKKFEAVDEKCDPCVEDKEGFKLFGCRSLRVCQLRGTQGQETAKEQVPHIVCKSALKQTLSGVKCTKAFQVHL